MSINPPVLPPGWGPAPNGRSAHSLLAPLYDYAEVTDARLDDLESRSGTSGTVTSVNGIGPDENGNITIPTSGGGAGLTEDPNHPGLYLIDQIQTVTPAAPTFTDEDGTTNDRYTIPASTGVQYVAAGAIRSAGTYTPTAGQTVNVVAQALAGYQLDGTTSWSYTFSTGTAPVEVTPVAPTADDATDTITITATTGVEYRIDAAPVSGTVNIGDVDTTVTVTAHALTGYTLTGTTSWQFEFTQAPSTPFSDYTAEVTADAPVVFYKLNEASGTPVDTMGNSTATVHGSVALGATAIIEGATSAEISTASVGTNAISIGRPAALDNMSAFTLEALVEPAAGTQGIINRSDAATTPRLAFILNSSAGLEFIARNVSGQVPAAVSPNSVFVWGEPIHLALTHDGITCRMYVNGVEVHNAAQAFTTTGAAAVNWEIGRSDSYSGGRGSLTGRMSGVAIYDKVLTPARILAHAQAAGLAA